MGRPELNLRILPILYGDRFDFVAVAPSWLAASGRIGPVFERSGRPRTGGYQRHDPTEIQHFQSCIVQGAHEVGLGIEDAERVQKIAAGIAGKRLTYRRANEATHA